MCYIRFARLAPALSLLLVLACDSRRDDSPVGLTIAASEDLVGRDAFSWSEPVWLGPIVNSPARDWNRHGGRRRALAGRPQPLLPLEPDGWARWVRHLGLSPRGSQLPMAGTRRPGSAGEHVAR